MKKMMLAMLAAGAVLTLAGCCCDKADKKCHKPPRQMCHKKHQHTPKACTPAQCPKQTTPAPAAGQQTPAAAETVVVEAVGN